jgi:3-methyladenine DNA glycosylase AlkD
MLASLVGEPDRVTPAQMERWAKSFENWAVCDTATFVLWDRTPHAWAKVREWSARPEEFVKRAAFAMLASLTVHDKEAPDECYREGLRLVEREATDPRNFVKKAVNWALRSIGKRSTALNREAIAVARRLAAADDPTSRWVGKDALRELTSPAVSRRLAARSGKRRRP